jgi:molybdenum cofactor cytidylyltransferase
VLYSNTSAIILAAGLSRRMGSINKLLIPIDGKPMVRRTVEQYVDAGIEKIVVVVGHEQHRIRAALSGLKVEMVFNDAFDNGQITSIRCGLKTISKNCQTVLIGLSDQPLLTANDIQQLLQTFLQQSSKSILVPYCQDVRGNPIVLSAKQALAVDRDGVRLGCRKLIDKHPEKVFCFEVTNNHYTCDLDNVEEVTQLLGENAITEVCV